MTHYNTRLENEAKNILEKESRHCIICNELIEDNIYYCPHCGEFNSCSGMTYKNIMSKADEF